MPKFTASERQLVKSMVATLSIKRIPDLEIIKEVERQTHKSISIRYLTAIKQQIKKESYHWYQTLRDNQYDFLHEFKERINEIVELQKRHYAIIDSPTEPTTVKQASLAELHKLNITLSNYFDVAPSIGNATLSETQTTTKRTSQQQDNNNIIV
jgi:hypothetical protein